MSFDNYIDDLGYYDVKITVPASFSIADPRAVNDIYYNINPDWKETGFVSRMNNRPAAILEANNEEAAFIYPIVTQKAGRSYLMPKLQTACNIELDLRISQNNMQLDVNPMVDIISKDDMSVYSGADTVAVYELEFKKKLFDRYSRCIGIYLRKAAHPAMLLRIALTDESYPQKDDYIRLLNKHYANNSKKAEEDKEFQKQLLSDCFYGIKTALLLVHPIAPTGCEMVRDYIGFSEQVFSWDHAFDSVESVLKHPEAPTKFLEPRVDFFKKPESQYHKA